MEISTTTIIALGAAVIHLLGIIAAVHAVFHARSSQGAVAWGILLVIFPYAALIPYAVFGRGKFHGYKSLTKARNREAAAALREVQREFTDPSIVRELHYPLPDALPRLSTLPILRHNRTWLLIDGERTFDAIFDAVKSAKSYILVQFFIVRHDGLGTRFKELLIQKAQEGVRVYFLFDELGSFFLGRRFLKDLSAVGIETSSFGTTRGRSNRFQLNFRNHRKIVVVDGEVAFVGGHNVGDEYVSKSPKFGHWRDTHLKMQGPVVQAVQLCFVQDWHFATRKFPHLLWTPKIADGDNQEMMMIASGPADAIDTCSLAFIEAIHDAKTRIWIAGPYFVPDQGVTAALQSAALRGVDVRILLPEKPDHLLVYLASFSTYESLLPLGVKLFRYTDGFMHQKVYVVDDKFAAVGTANVDNRSFRLNFEIMMLCDHPRFVQDVDAMLKKDLTVCRPVHLQEYTEASFLFRFAVKVARLFEPIL